MGEESRQSLVTARRTGCRANECYALKSERPPVIPRAVQMSYMRVASIECVRPILSAVRRGKDGWRFLSTRFANLAAGSLQVLRPTPKDLSPRGPQRDPINRNSRGCVECVVNPGSASVVDRSMDHASGSVCAEEPPFRPFWRFLRTRRRHD